MRGTNNDLRYLLSYEKQRPWLSGRCCPFAATLRRLSDGGPEDLRLSAAASAVNRARRRVKRVRSRYKVYREPSEGATVAHWARFRFSSG